MSHSQERVNCALTLTVGGAERNITPENLQDAEFIEALKAEASEVSTPTIITCGDFYSLPDEIGYLIIALAKAVVGLLVKVSPQARAADPLSALLENLPLLGEPARREAGRRAAIAAGALLHDEEVQTVAASIAAALCRNDLGKVWIPQICRQLEAKAAELRGDNAAMLSSAVGVQLSTDQVLQWLRDMDKALDERQLSSVDMREHLPYCR